MTSTPRGGNFGVKSVKLMYFLMNLILYPWAWFKQTKCIVIMTKEGSNKNTNFMTPGAGFLVLGHSHMSYSESLLWGIIHITKCLLKNYKTILDQIWNEASLG